MISPSPPLDRVDKSRTRRLLILLVLAFVVPRVVLLIAATGVPMSDAKWYFDRAVSIAHGNGYAFDGTPTAFWPVGYPGFLGLLFSIFPESPGTGLIANFFLAAITMVCAFRIYCELPISTNWALFGTLVLSIFPNFILYQNLLLSEMLMTSLLFLSVLGLTSAQRKYQFLLTGVSFGLATLVKSQVLFLPFFVLIYDVWKSRRWLFVASKYLVLCLGMAIVIVPWTIRNYVVFHRVIMIQSNGGYNLLMGNNQQNRWGGSTGTSSEFAAMFPGVVADINQRLADEMSMNDRATATALRFMSSNPMEVLKRVPYKLYRFFRHDPQGIGSLLRANAAAGQNLPWLSSLFSLSFWYYTFVMMLAMLSPIAFVFSQLRTRTHFILLSVILYFTLISTIFFGEGRFHIPILPAFVGCMLVTLQAAARVCTNVRSGMNPDH